MLIPTAQRQFSFFSSSNFSEISVLVWLGSILVFLFISLVIAAMLKVYKRDQKVNFSIAFEILIKIAKKPLIFLMVSGVFFSALLICKIYFQPAIGKISDVILVYSLKSIEFITILWLLINTTHFIKTRLLVWSAQSDKKIFGIIFPMISNSLEAVFCLIIVNVYVSELNLSDTHGLLIEKLMRILLIFTLSWVFFQLINGLEKAILNRYITDKAYDISVRKIHTQVTLLKKIVLCVGGVISVGAALMVFESVKAFGTGLLTAAGLASALVAFACQQSLGRIFAGLQIAFTQPIRVGDDVIIDNEFGQVEEITLSYIVIKLWDLRRLILPTDYFASRGLQNLTRESTQLYGTFFLYIDYTLPVAAVREKFCEFIAESKFWDNNLNILQVTDSKENTIELRALMSAKNAANLWDLRCEMREKIIKFITENYPDCLPKIRHSLPPLKENEMGKRIISGLAEIL